MPSRACILSVAAIALSACSHGPYPASGVKPTFSFPVTTNDTPYSRCLADLGAVPANNLPVIAVGEIADKTGQIDKTNYSTVFSQGITEMMISAFQKTHRANLVERFDLRVPLAEARMTQLKLTTEKAAPTMPVRASNFVVMGALTELNYNIVSDGAGLFVSGIGGSGRTVVINVGLDVRVVNSQSFDVAYVSSLQKQIYGYEVEANIFRFFGSRLVEFNAGRIQNEPLQLGVRSVVEMAVYQIMTDYLGLPTSQGCGIEQSPITTEHASTIEGEQS